MRKPLHIWITFLACLGLLLAAMAWVSWHTLALERTREEAARDADQQERVRLALWRLDFQASALMIRENARPPHDFRPFHSPEGLVNNKTYSNVAKGEVLVPSPLLAETPEHVLLHFQMDARGQIISPQVPQNGERTLALAQFINADDLTRCEQRLSGLRELLAQPAHSIAPKAEVSSYWPGSSTRTPAPAPTGPPIYNRQILAEQASVPRLDFDDNKMLAANDVNLPRNNAWAVQEGQAATQQQLQLNSTENALRSRAVTAQNEEAIKQQPMIKMKEPPAKDLAQSCCRGSQTERQACGEEDRRGNGQGRLPCRCPPPLLRRRLRWLVRSTHRRRMVSAPPEPKARRKTCLRSKARLHPRVRGLFKACGWASIWC
jgi:hypothetical protein